VDDAARDEVDETVAARPVEAASTTPGAGVGRMLGVGAVGLGMGAAEVVPGFSGGTVALLGGVYEQLVANVRQGARALALLVRGRPRDGVRAVAAIEWSFILPLLVANLLAIVLLAGALSDLLETHPRQLSAVFLGLVLGATVVAAGDVRRPSPALAGVTVLTAVCTFVLLGYSGGTLAGPGLLVYFGAGAVAVCAMILPGISGSFLLLLLGMYPHVIGAVDDRDLVVLGVFAVGCLIGLASFSTFLNWLLRTHHDVVLAALLGLMVGSSRVLWPWPGAEVGDPRLAGPVAGELATIALLALGALGAVIVAGHLARRLMR
jgi:putative membrane protein